MSETNPSTLRPCGRARSRSDLDMLARLRQGLQAIDTGDDAGWEPPAAPTPQEAADLPPLPRRKPRRAGSA